MKAGAKMLFQNITAGRIITDVAVSFAIKFTLEIVLAALFLAITGQTFDAVYGIFGIETVGRFLRGDHPWLEGSEGVLLLALIVAHHELRYGPLDRLTPPRERPSSRAYWPEPQSPSSPP